MTWDLVSPILMHILLDSRVSYSGWGYGGGVQTCFHANHHQEVENISQTFKSSGTSSQYPS
jgi:hypothetical protein